MSGFENINTASEGENASSTSASNNWLEMGDKRVLGAIKEMENGLSGDGIKIQPVSLVQQIDRITHKQIVDILARELSKADMLVDGSDAERALRTGMRLVINGEDAQAVDRLASEITDKLGNRTLKFATVDAQTKAHVEDLTQQNNNPKPDYIRVAQLYNEKGEPIGSIGIVMASPFQQVVVSLEKDKALSQKVMAGIGAELSRRYSHGQEKEADALGPDLSQRLKQLLPATEKLELKISEDLQYSAQVKKEAIEQRKPVPDYIRYIELFKDGKSVGGQYYKLTRPGKEAEKNQGRFTA